MAATFLQAGCRDRIYKRCVLQNNMLSAVDPWEVLYTPRPDSPDYAAKIEDFIFFCSEYPSAESPEFSNWFNNYYVAGKKYKGVGGLEFWCAEQELMYRKVSELCANTEWKKKQMAEIMAIEPEPVIPVGEESWEQVWSANHDKAGDIKLSARKGELELNDALWVKERQKVMFEIVLDKFSQLELAAMLLQTRGLILVEAAWYDRNFGIGLQTGEFVVKGKPNKPGKVDSVLVRDAKTSVVNWNHPPGSNWGLNILGEALMQVRVALAVQQ